METIAEAIGKINGREKILHHVSILYFLDDYKGIKKYIGDKCPNTLEKVTEILDHIKYLESKFRE